MREFPEIAAIEERHFTALEGAEMQCAANALAQVLRLASLPSGLEQKNRNRALARHCRGRL
jgi:hypothetical protein